MSAYDRRTMRRWSYRLRWWPWARRALLDVAAESWQMELREIDAARRGRQAERLK